MAYEDFTTYTVVHAGTEISHANATVLTFTDWDTRSESYVESYAYIDKGASHFGSDFTHQFEVNISSITSNPRCVVWGVSDTADHDGRYWNDGMSLSFAYADGQIIATNGEDGTETDVGGGTTGLWSTGTTYYVTAVHDWDGGANSTGQCVITIRTGSHTGSTVATRTLTRSAGQQTAFRYLYALSSWVTGNPSQLASGTVSNLDINEIVTSIELEGFRFRNDDGSESAATWKDSQDVNITLAANTSTRIRAILNATGDPASIGAQLEYRYKPSGGAFGAWTKVTS